jgi:hypothetical protein
MGCLKVEKDGLEEEDCRNVYGDEEKCKGDNCVKVHEVEDS